MFTKAAEYYLFLVTGALTAVAVYFYNYYRKNKSMPVSTLAVFLGTAVLAFLTACLVEFLTVPILRVNANLDSFLSGGFQLYYSVLAFFAFSFLILRLLKKDAAQELNTAVPSVIIFAAVARIGCMLAGCCDGKTIGVNGEVFPSRLMELIFAIIAFVLLQFIFSKNRLRNYILSYSVFRFITEFFRAGRGEYRLFGVFAPAQWLAVIACFVLIINMLPLSEERIKK